MGVRVFIVGLSGSGKSTLAREIGARHGAPIHELDWMVWDRGSESGLMLPFAERAALAERVSAEESWVVEGVYFGEWAAPFMDRADVIAWLDVPAPVALWRVLWRHLKAEARRDNRFPGWRRLCRFMRLVANQYRGTSEPVSEDDPALSRQNIATALASYTGKVVKGRGEAVLREVTVRLEGAASQTHRA